MNEASTLMRGSATSPGGGEMGDARASGSHLGEWPPGRGWANGKTQRDLPPSDTLEQMAHLHEYPVLVEWTGGREGHGNVLSERSGITNPLSVPPEFQGPGQGTNPEELLTSAIAACYSITFGIVAANQKLPVNTYSAKAVGVVEQAGATFTYKSITIKAEIQLDRSATDEQVAKAEDMAHRADAYCIITNAVRDKVNIVVEPTITRG
ncbi:MAG: OsmC family protein [Armatimonadetes bacterium]|nr:OsmC family protein [Armatimonadota bacterium]